MTPSSSHNLLLFTVFFVNAICTMEKIERSSSLTDLDKKGRKLILTSSSMVFPLAKGKKTGESGSLRGSLIKRLWPSKSETVNKESSASSLSESISNSGSSTSVLALHPEFTYHKPFYTILIEGKATTVIIDGPCTGQYRVGSLSEFSSDSPYLRRPEIISFLNRLLSLHTRNVTTHTKGSKIHRYIKRYAKGDSSFTKPFYVVRKEGTGDRICVFAEDISNLS